MLFPRRTSSASRKVHHSTPERWRRGRRVAALVSFACVVLTIGTLSYSDQGKADALDSWWLRARFSFREWLRGPQRDNRIAIVEIDDKSLNRWAEPLIMWGGHMADTINQLHRSGARVIALDWTQPIPTDNLFLKFKDNDEKLGKALSQAGNVVFVKLIKPDGSYLVPTPSLLYSLPDAYKDEGQSYMGFAETEAVNGIWTRIRPIINTPQGREVSFAQRIAERSGMLKNTKPTEEHLLINFGINAGLRGTQAPFEWASLCDVAKATRPDPRWKNKIVFIGATYKGSNDLHSVPILGMGSDEKQNRLGQLKNVFSQLSMSRTLDGVEVQAHAVKTILDNQAIIETPSIVRWLCSVLLAVIGVAVFTVTAWGWRRAAFASLSVALSWALLSLFLFYRHDVALPFLLPVASLLSGTALMGGYRAFREERERAQVMNVWGRHQHPRLIEFLLAHPEMHSGDGREMGVTVLFADLKRFTKTVESLPPMKAVEALNRYLTLFASTILEHGGIVDKYLGDGLMAQWGAPEERADHADAALRACLAIEERLRALTPQLTAEGRVTFGVRLTLHSGTVLAGLLGPEQKLEYTIIGDTVNVTSRLQETAKSLGADFLISETTLACLSDDLSKQIQFGVETEVEIRDREKPLRVYEVRSEMSDASKVLVSES